MGRGFTVAAEGEDAGFFHVQGFGEGVAAQEVGCEQGEVVIVANEGERGGVAALDELVGGGSGRVVGFEAGGFKEEAVGAEGALEVLGRFNTAEKRAVKQVAGCKGVVGAEELGELGALGLAAGAEGATGIFFGGNGVGVADEV